MKGHQSIYQSLFADENSVSTVADTAPERKGRSEALKAKQNELIVARYYYYIKIQGRQYEATLELLQAEIFLSTYTLVDIIKKNAHQLRLLKTAQPDVKWFRSRYPFLTWQHLFQ
jgi:hypothetical protein